ncbi:MAG TPA: GxxExxY protein [Verrucomicrobiae bacterium]|nr:GxxExxY protein [Verrucomicrobiae bacterium]
MDLLINGSLVLEIKSLSALPEVALAQTPSYLRATGLKRAVIINFGEQWLKDGIKRVSL